MREQAEKKLGIRLDNLYGEDLEEHRSAGSKGCKLYLPNLHNLQDSVVRGAFQDKDHKTE